ncbi:MAG: ATP-binding protein [Clostridiales bacterium]|nr:ATP-binding protein [Clostridiales bacterium]
MEKRITIITGHYGSGKTEFAINYVMAVKKKHESAALIDLDIANPYFRSREKQGMLENEGIAVYSNVFGYDITADLPAITAELRAPLEDESMHAVIDAGGDDSGARVLNQFRKYFGDGSTMLFVVNANRPETGTVEGAARHMVSIMDETGVDIGGIVNNTHMLKETSSKDVLKGYELCKGLSERFGIPILYSCCRKDLCEGLEKEASASGYDLGIFPLSIFMRDAWMDNNILRRTKYGV